jgi:regulator of CtrA degradation
MENLNQNNISEQNNVFKFTQKSYNETLSLLSFSRDYFSTNGRLDKLNLSSEDSILYTIAMSKITTQLTGVLSWLLMCKAIESGEVKIQELSKEDFSMPATAEQIKIDNSRFINLNSTVKELLKKSSNIYNRIKRLENSVHEMMESQNTELAH